MPCIVVLVLVVAATGGYFLLRAAPAAPIAGVVRATEIRVAPEVGGQLAAIKVRKGDTVHAGDVVAELSAIELTASVGAGARRAGGRDRRPQQRLCRRARRADRDAGGGDRQGEVAAGVCADSSSGAPPTWRAATTASQQSLDQAENDVATARADVAEAQANHAAAVAGPTNEERVIADAQVRAAAAALAVLERQLDKTVLRSPVDGVVSVIVGRDRRERPCRPAGARDRGDRQAMAVVQRARGSAARPHGRERGRCPVAGAGRTTPAVVTELRPLGAFATWQAERAVGDHDRNTLRLRLDPQAMRAGLSPA